MLINNIFNFFFTRVSHFHFYIRKLQKILEFFLNFFNLWKWNINIRRSIYLNASCFFIYVYFIYYNTFYVSA